MSKRFQIINVLRKPRKCPNCGEKEQSVTFWSDDFAGETGIRKFLKSPEGKFFKGDEEVPGD